MATLNPPKRISRRHELREDKVITFYARAWEFYDQNRKLVYGVAAGLIVLVIAIVGYVLYQNRQAKEAERILGGTVALYESGALREAIEGTADQLGLVEIAEEYGNTPAGNLAHFYAADAYYQLGEYDRALEHFEAYDESKDFLGAASLAGAAAVYENREEYARAAELYRRAARLFESELTTPEYLLKAGRAYELAGDYAAALAAYQTIRDEYADSDPAGEIEVFIARVEAKQQS